MKLGRSIPFGWSSIWMPPSSDAEEYVPWFTSTCMMSWYFVTAQ